MNDLNEILAIIFNHPLHHLSTPPAPLHQIKPCFPAILQQWALSAHVSVFQNDQLSTLVIVNFEL